MPGSAAPRSRPPTTPMSGPSSTRLSSRVAGEVLTVAVNDFQRVKAGDLLVQIDPADYEAQVAQAEAGVAGAQAALDNLRQSGRTAIRDHCAGRGAAGIRGRAGGRGASGAGAAAVADADRSRHAAKARTGHRGLRQARRPMFARAAPSSPRNVTSSKCCPAPRSSARRTSRAPRRRWPRPSSGSATPRSWRRSMASSASGRCSRATTSISAPTSINVVPLPNVYVIANYKETQLTRVKPGQPVDDHRRQFPEREDYAAASSGLRPPSGSQFALLPPDNATGNFTKVVQRIPVRIQLDKNQPLLERLLPGMSVVTHIQYRRGGHGWRKVDDADRRGRSRVAASRRSRCSRLARCCSAAFLANFDSRLTIGRPAGSARRVLARLRRGRLALDRGHRLADLHRAGGGVARDRIRPAPRARHSEPGLCPDLAGDPVRARLRHADRAQHRAWPAARHLRAGDADDRPPQSADQMVAAGDLDLFDPGRLRARHLHARWSASTSIIWDGSGCIGRAW